MIESALQAAVDSQGRANSLPSFNVLGVRVDAVQIPDVIARMQRWIKERQGSRFIAVTGMHGVMEAQHDPHLKCVLKSADMVVPDGMPLVWLGRLRGFGLRRRVYGPELMLEFCRTTATKGYRHFLYGGVPGVVEELGVRLRREFPGHVVAGTFSPPFRELTVEENEAVAEMIRRAAPDVLWVGLSTPRQERWMADFRERLSVPVMVGVGAAFDLHTGRVRQAPSLMREHGLEWLWRLMMEPRRLWRRYLILGSEFVWRVSLELLGIRP
jgi:N-acetylglucosaminyldiphosphoundecaprenol N-acetyl-beta-D-mannosaminyltransferase